MFQRRHYDFIAEVLRGLKMSEQQTGEGTLEDVQTAFMEAFRLDNANFKAEVFDNACRV